MEWSPRRLHDEAAIPSSDQRIVTSAVSFCMSLARARALLLNYVAPSRGGAPQLGETQSADQPSENRVYFMALSLRTRTPGARALLPATRCQSSGPLGALLSSPALDVRLMTALQVLQVLLASTHTALVSSPSLAVLHLSTYEILT